MPLTPRIVHSVTGSDRHTVERNDISQPYSSSEADFLILEARSPRGGVGGGGGGGGRSGGGSVSGGSGSGSGSGRTGGSGTSSGGTGSAGAGAASKGFSPGSVSGGRSVYGSTAGRGVASPYAITSGAFAGRQAGGGQRANVYGNRGYYGSGYPGSYAGRGALAGGAVGALGFPFIFWPVFWPNNYYGSRVYGPANNDTRPGGEQTLYVLAPPAGVDTTDGANNFALYGDANSVDAVWTTLQSGCGVGDQLAANYSINPNQTVQWYRGSSFALLLEDYNNMVPNVTVDSSANDTTAVTSGLAALPASVNSTYLDCLNSTIGTNVPLVEAAQTDGALHALSLGFHFLGLNAHGALSAVLPALVLATVLGAGAGGVGF